MKENVEFSRCIYVLDFALEDVITYIEDTITYSDELKILVFQLKNLTDQQKKHIIFLGAATKSTKHVYATIIKNQVLENVFCLCKNKKRKFTFITLDSEIGRALFEACQSSSHDDGMVIAKAASVIHNQLLNNEKVFNGNLSQERQMASIP